MEKAGHETEKTSVGGLKLSSGQGEDDLSKIPIIHDEVKKQLSSKLNEEGDREHRGDWCRGGLTSWQERSQFGEPHLGAAAVKPTRNFMISGEEEHGKALQQGTKRATNVRV